MTVRVLAAVAVHALAACASAGGAVRDRGVVEVRAGAAPVRIVHGAEDAGAAARVAAAVPGALARAARWGVLTSPVTIVVHPTHAALEAAAERPGRPWLRAWAAFDRIDLQSPRTWWPLGATAAAVEAVLAHELAHCVTYQAAGTARSWATLDLPLWFREGIAGSTSERRAGVTALAQLAAIYRGRGELGPGVLDVAALDAAGAREPLDAAEADLAYGAAELKLEFLADRYGDERIRGVLAGLAAGRSFPDAFRDAIGIEAAELDAEFVRYVVWGGWAGGR